MIEGEKWHKTVLNKIIDDIRLAPSNRLLAELVNLYLSSDGEDREFFKALALSFKTNKAVRWNAGNEIPAERADAMTEEARQHIKDVLLDSIG
jgi:hypothetical protein